MKNKGFTLIELLGVIVILSVLMLLVLPKIVNSIKSSSYKVDEITQKLVYNATDLYIDSKKNSFKKLNGASYCVSFSDLVDFGYLKSPITSSSNIDLTDLKSVKITYKNNKFNYEIVDIDKCKQEIFCGFTNGDGTEIGDEFVCGNEHFYVINNNGTNIDMLAKYNLSTTEAPYLQSESNAGGVTFFESTPEVLPESFSYIYENSENLIYPYIQTYQNYLENTLGLSVVSAKLMSFDQAQSLGCNTLYNDTHGGGNFYYCTNAESWVYSTNYWLGSSAKLDNESTYIYSIAVIPYSSSGDRLLYTIGPFYHEIGIRPVISIPVDFIESSK